MNSEMSQSFRAASNLENTARFDPVMQPTRYSLDRRRVIRAMMSHPKPGGVDTAHAQAQAGPEPSAPGS